MTIPSDHELMKDFRQRMNAAERQVQELQRENDALKSAMDGDSARLTRWLQSKVHRQRTQLDYLTGRNTRLRWQLRQIDELGRSLTKDEYESARKAEENAGVAARIGSWQDR